MTNLLLGTLIGALLSMIAVFLTGVTTELNHHSNQRAGVSKVWRGHETNSHFFQSSNDVRHARIGAHPFNQALCVLARRRIVVTKNAPKSINIRLEKI